MKWSAFSISVTFDVGIDHGKSVSNKYTVRNLFPYTGELERVIVRMTDR